MYGSPEYSGKQVQAPTPFRSLHTALAPQGLGLQGIGISGGMLTNVRGGNKVFM